jgi:pimeloyl-ACP methyl ester carboxylesterase
VKVRHGLPGVRPDELGWIERERAAHERARRDTKRSGRVRDDFTLVRAERRVIRAAEYESACVSAQTEATNVCIEDFRLLHGVARAHVLGLSWGGILAQEFYRMYPKRLRSLVLADTYAGWKGSLPEPSSSRKRAREHA